MLLSISSAMACAVSRYPELRMERMASCCGMISCGMSLLLRALIPDAFPVAETLRDASVAGDLVDDSDDWQVAIAPSLRPSGARPTIWLKSTTERVGRVITATLVRGASKPVVRTS